MRLNVTLPSVLLSPACAPSLALSNTERRQRRREAEVALLPTATSKPASAKRPKNPSLPGTAGAVPPTTITIDIQTPEGLTRYHLQRLPGALYVERQHSQRQGLQTLQSARFGDVRGFQAWCDEDPLRFDKPHLLARVRWEGCGLWPLDPGANGGVD